MLKFLMLWYADAYLSEYIFLIVLHENQIIPCTHLFIGFYILH